MEFFYRRDFSWEWNKEPGLCLGIAFGPTKGSYKQSRQNTTNSTTELAIRKIGPSIPSDVCRMMSARTDTGAVSSIFLDYFVDALSPEIIQIYLEKGQVEQRCSFDRSKESHFPNLRGTVKTRLFHSKFIQLCVTFNQEFNLSNSSDIHVRKSFKLVYRWCYVWFHRID